MQIPNSIITMRLHSGVGYGPIIAPAYEAKLYRKLHGTRLLPEYGTGGIDVQPYPDAGIDDTRYTDAPTLDIEMGRLRTKFKGDARGPLFDQVFDEADFKATVEKMLIDEAARIRANRKPKEASIPHASFTAFGLTEAQAVALQGAGFANRDACVGMSLMDLNNVGGIGIELAQRLSDEPVKEAKAK
jgi:hypothetical protein